VLVGSKVSAAPVYELPGRTFTLLHGPGVTGSQNLSLGLSVFPAGSKPEGHVHPAEEEIVYVVSGRGQLVASDCVVELEAGVAVYIPPGIKHATVAYDDGPLTLVCSFSPPVTPGTYDPTPCAPASAQAAGGDGMHGE
jgi:quercetin dioxygenase-like cupin family protein